MKSDTAERAKAMLRMLLEERCSYEAVGRAHGVARTTAERLVKSLAKSVVAAMGVDGLDMDSAGSTPHMKQCAAQLLSAVDKFDPKQSQPARRWAALSAAEIALGAKRLRDRSDNPNRDVALIYVLLATGLKTRELASLKVSDYLTEGGEIREVSVLREEVAWNGRVRPLYFNSDKACRAVDAYIEERVRRGIRSGVDGRFRGLDGESMLFLTEQQQPFTVRSRTPTDPRPACPLMTATLRVAFQRAGWHGFSAQAARRMVATRLQRERGGSDTEVCQLMGLTNSRALRRLQDQAGTPLVALSRDLV